MPATARFPKRLAVAARPVEYLPVLEAIRQSAGGRLERLIHIGKSYADYKASSLLKIDAGQGRCGHLAQDNRFSGMASALETGPEMAAIQAEMIDHLTRAGRHHDYKGHALETLHDYQHAVHVINDAMAAMLVRERIEAIVLFEIPHMVFDTSLYYVAKTLGLKTLILRQSFFPQQFFSMISSRDLGKIPACPAGDDVEPYDLSDQDTSTLFYMKGIGQDRQQPGRLTARSIVQMLIYCLRNDPAKLVQPSALYQIICRMRRISGIFPGWRDPFARFFHTDHLAYFEYLAEVEEKQLDMSRRYVYFPLQLQPEMTTSSLGGRYRDQLLAIERLAEMLPEDYVIYVKENPKQDGKMRRPMFFHRLARIRNAELAPSYANTKALIEHAAAVATISGTAGWEALVAGKPVLVFGSAWYGSAPGVTRYRPHMQFGEILGNRPKRTELERFAGLLRKRSHAGVVQHDFMRADKDIDPQENARVVAETVLALLDGRLEHSFAPWVEAE